MTSSRSQRRPLKKGDRVRGGAGVHGPIIRWNAYLRCFVVQWDHARFLESYAWRDSLRALPRPHHQRQRKQERNPRKATR
jgi:hypothetical protein